jgi:hypothetical protein
LKLVPVEGAVVDGEADGEVVAGEVEDDLLFWKLKLTTTTTWLMLLF